MKSDGQTEQLASIIGEMREWVRDKLVSMEAEGVTCSLIEDVQIMLTEDYNLMYRFIFEDK